MKKIFIALSLIFNQCFGFDDAEKIHTPTDTDNSAAHASMIGLLLACSKGQDPGACDTLSQRTSIVLDLISARRFRGCHIIQVR